MEKNVTNLFFNMFKASFFDHLVGAPAQHFTLWLNESSKPLELEE